MNLWNILSIHEFMPYSNLMYQKTLWVPGGYSLEMCEICPLSAEGHYGRCSFYSLAKGESLKRILSKL
jgi:hypothetical protein